MSRESVSRGRRPFKVWDSSRGCRKALVVSSLEELIVRGREKLNISSGENVRAVLESDGTQVDDAEYFKSLEQNSTLLLLRPGEKWAPAGVNVIRAALSSIPKIVCEAISCLDLQDEVPSWKIMESRGRITIVLNWDQRPPHEGILGSAGGPSGSGSGGGSGGMKGRMVTSLPGGSLLSSGDRSAASSLGVSPTGNKYPHGIRTMVNKDGKLETIINDFGSQHRSTPSITICRDDGLGGGKGQPPCSNRGLPRQGSSSLESATGTGTAPIHVHTVECSQRGLFNAASPSTTGRQSPPEPSTCDFHCCALHEEGRKIQVHKNVSTSPVDPSMFDPLLLPGAHHHHSRSSTHLKPNSGHMPSSSSHTHHVRFMDVSNSNNNNNRHNNNHHHHHHHLPPPPNIIEITKDTQSTSSASSSSEESEETENVSSLEMKSVKTLLLTDSCNEEVCGSGSGTPTTAPTKSSGGLSIKDIGVILERLGSKIVDVERLDRSYGDHIVRWSIRATVVGECNCGVVYNGKYYSICENGSCGTDFSDFPPPPPPHEDYKNDEEDMRL